MSEQRETWTRIGETVTIRRAGTVHAQGRLIATLPGDPEIALIELDGTPMRGVLIPEFRREVDADGMD